MTTRSKDQQQFWSWNMNDLVRERELDEDFGERLPSRRYDQRITDIFHADHLPPVGSILVGAIRRGPDVSVIALGQVHSSQGVAAVKVRASIQPLIRLIEVPHAHLAASQSQARRFKRLLSPESLRPARLSGRDADDLVVALKRQPEIAAWLESLEPVSVDLAEGEHERLREERDAIQTGIAMAGIELPESTFTATSAAGRPQATDWLNGNLFEDNEDDLLFADLRSFDAGGKLAKLSASTSVFTDGAFKLQIANVNRKPLEHALGVDLLYWDQTADSFTLLQYKRLQRASGGGWHYARKQDLVKQLGKMDKIPRATLATANDWRISPSPFWFKFVRPDTFDPGDTQVLKGMYVPSDYLRLGISTNSFVGPQGGFSFGYDNARYLRRSSFVELVREHLTGSTTSATKEIHKVLASISKKSEVVVVAKARA